MIKMANENIVNVDEVNVPVGMNGEFWGASENDNVPQMLDASENGIIKVNDEVVATFASVAHAMASLYLSKFSPKQIKVLIPGLVNISDNLITKIVADTTSRNIRKDFIVSLKGNMPRPLTINEYVAVVKVVGEPNGKYRNFNINEILENIKIDSENVDYIIPEKKTISAKVEKPVDIEKLNEKIAKDQKLIEKHNTKIGKLNKKLEKFNAILVANPSSANAKYNAKKIENNIVREQMQVTRLEMNIKDLQSRIPSEVASVVTPTETVSEENT